MVSQGVVVQPFEKETFMSFEKASEMVVSSAN